MKLLSSQKDKLFDLIEETNFSPIQFDIIEEDNSDNQIETKFIFKSSDFFFSFKTSSNIEYSIFSPGQSTYESEENGGWIVQMKHFHYWLHFLNREIVTPNKWDRLKDEIKNINFEYINN